jgi:2OG-Fe(II) oxygenase superfamily
MGQKKQRLAPIVLRQYMDESRCLSVIQEIQTYRQSHQIPEIKRLCKDRSLDYGVIDGIKIKDHLPAITRIAEEIQQEIIQILNVEVRPITDRAAVNVNVTRQRGEYRWHYDRNDISAILYLNSISGGELEFYSNYRFLLEGSNNGRLQQALDRLVQSKMIRNLFGKKTTLHPEPGMLLIFDGIRTLHSVAPVLSDEERICIVFAFDRADSTSKKNYSLDSYLYSENEWKDSDPNYLSSSER